jgi:hypothetical protein
MTSEFVALMQASTAVPAVRFIYTAPTPADLSTYVISISSISRDAFLTSGNCTVVLDNGSGYFNDFLDTANQLYGSVEISLYFPELDPAEYLPLFTGYVESIEMGIDTITMRLLDRFSLCLAIEVGSSEAPITNLAITPADMAWTLLTVYAGLDSTASIANVDIDWTTWDAWHDDMDAGGNEYHLGSRFCGQTIGYILQRIMTLTNSVFWVNGLGKICFAPPQGAGSTIPFTKEYCIDRQFAVDLNGIVDDITAYYGLNTATDVFAGNYNHSHAAVIRSVHEVEEDRNLWHYDLTSATRYVTERLAKYSGGPVRTFTLQTWLVGFLSDISAVENLFNHFSAPNNTIDITITDITFDLMSYEATFTGQWVW